MVDCGFSYSDSAKCIGADELRSKSYWYSYYTPTTSVSLSQNCALYKNRAIAPSTDRVCQGNYIAPECTAGTIEDRKTCTKLNYKPACVPDSVYSNLQYDCPREEQRISDTVTANLRTGCFRYWDAKASPSDTTKDISSRWRAQRDVILEQMKPASGLNVVSLNVPEKVGDVSFLKVSLTELGTSKFVQPSSCTPASQLKLQ
jgi:hypothetical protein